MRKYFYIILLVASASYSQDFSLIKRAERILNSEKPNLAKAEKLLIKATKKDYGFCGNATISALSKIKYLTARIFYLQHKYKKALETLDSGETWETQKESDLLKVMCLSKLYGISTIRDLILEHSNEIINRGEDFRYKKVCLNLEAIKYDFCFYDQNEELNYKHEVTISEIIATTNFYSLLKQD